MVHLDGHSLDCRANLRGFASHIHVLYREVPWSVVHIDGHSLDCRANLRGFASHIHVLYREVPFILNIKKTGQLLAGPFTVVIPGGEGESHAREYRMQDDLVTAIEDINV